MSGNDWGTQARAAFAGAREPAKLATAVVTFHRKLDEVIAATVAGHAIPIACTKGCHYCCSLRVETRPYEAFTLAAWLRRHFSASQLDAVLVRLRENVRRTRELGEEGRKRTALACALLGSDGACTAYEARPAACRKFHSSRVEICKAWYDEPTDASIENPEHPAVSHNASVIITQARQALRAAGFDDSETDLNVALLEALENPKAERRWRDGKKAFVPR